MSYAHVLVEIQQNKWAHRHLRQRERQERFWHTLPLCVDARGF